MHIDPQTGELVPDDDIYGTQGIGEAPDPEPPADPYTPPPAPGGNTTPQPPPTSPGNYPAEMNYPGLTPEDVKAREEQVGGFLNDQAQSAIGRRLDAGEYAYAQTLYRNKGGTAYRAWLAQKAGGARGGDPTTMGAGAVPGTSNYPIAGGQTFFSYPDWTPPEENFGTFKAPARNINTPFAYQDFEGPNADTFQADPGYDFRTKQMDESVKNARSATGGLATGKTLADLMEYRGGLASQEFGNVWNRGYQTYNTNRNNKFDEWKSGRSLDDSNFTHDLTSYLTDTQAKSDDWTRSQQKYMTNLNKEASSYGLNLDTSNLNLGRDSSQFANLLSLYNIMTRTLPTYTPTA